VSVLAVDQGTTGTTCLVIGDDGKIAGRGYREITQHYPHPGWVEHDPQEILERTVAAARAAIDQASVTPRAVGITNQRETVLIWDRKSGQPVGPAIVWQDRRTADRCAELRPEAGRIERLTGLVIDPYFSATKLELLLRDRDVAARAASGDILAGTIDTWLIWRLTNGAVHATDPSNASRTMLYDINRLEWSPELGDLFGVPGKMLPEVRPSSGDFGVAAAEWFGSAIPIRGVAGDQQAALFGQGCWNAGEGKNTYGTGAFLLFNAGTKRPDGGGGLLTTIACGARGEAVFALEASIFIAGAAVQWLRDGLGLLASASEVEALARSVPDTGGVVFVPALVGLGAPYWDAEARGLICGITRGTTRAHLARATLDAIAQQISDLVEAMAADAGVKSSSMRMRVDGGASANQLLLELQASYAGVRVERPKDIETTARGAAMLAALGTGVAKDLDALRGWSLPDVTVEPTLDAAVVREGRAAWKTAVARTRSTA